MDNENFTYYNHPYLYTKIDKNGGFSLGDFVPPNLQIFNENYSIRQVQICSFIHSDLINLINAANSEKNINFRVASGYRSFSYQRSLFNFYVNQILLDMPNLSEDEANTIVNESSAKPGYSEHQLGTVVDLLSDECNYSFAVKEGMIFVKWLENNSRNFNFNISYPKNNEQYIYEPWHLRWFPDLS